MREIIFRGKTYDGMWIEGAYYHANKNYSDPADVHYIIPTTESLDYEQALEYFPVDPATVGQYTGLKDKNGKRIFEGDELSWHNGSGAVNFGGGCFCVRLHGEIEYYGRNNPAIDVIFNLYPELEVIGNIHDNPELLEVR